jgi:DNA-binding beta-propeller fold protein YncE
MLSNGELAVVNVAARQQVGRIPIGGGVTGIRMAPGDTSLYLFTTVGVLVEVDTRTNAVKRQIAVNLGNTTDFVIANDGLFYVLDGPNNIVRLFDVTTLTTVRSIGVPPNATTIAVTPDAQQVWLTHTNPVQVSVYTGNRNTGFLATGVVPFGQALPLRTYISPSGAIAVVTNIGGWIDIIR